MLRTFETCRSDTVGTFADLFRSTLAVLCLCTIVQRLLSKSITVSPFRALVVTAQPVRVIALDTLRVAVLLTISAAGACAVLAFALLVVATVGVVGVGSGLRFHLALAVTISPCNT